MTNDAGPIHAAIDALCAVMDAFAEAGRNWHPDQAPLLVEDLLPQRGTLLTALEAFERAEWPTELADAREPCTVSARTLLEGFDGLEAADPMVAFRSLRANTVAQETLYPAATSNTAISRFFVPAECRTDEALLARLDATTPVEGAGVTHFANERDQRGGFSLYVPEYLGGQSYRPLVIALHGGSGHGRDFVWTWLKAARAMGVIVLSPTSANRTWSLMGADLDSPNIRQMAVELARRYPIDLSRVLLTGMSDGGTFSTLCGVLGLIPATHFAPISSTFNARLLDLAPAGRLDGLPFYLVHGEHDWMFPVEVARGARDALRGAGAALEYREIADLGHAYPREQNSRILEWFLGAHGNSALAT